MSETPSQSSVGTETSLFYRKVFIVCAGVFILAMMIQPLCDPDLFVHLRDGRFLMESGFKTTPEPFSYTIADKPFEAPEWLFKISLFTLYKLGGFTLVSLVKALVVTQFIFLLGLLIYRKWPNMVLVSIFICAAILAPNSRIIPVKPFLAMYLLLPFALILLDDYARVNHEKDERRYAKRLWWIPIIMIPWANTHQGFLFLFGILFAYFTGCAILYYQQEKALDKRRAIRIGLITALSLCTAMIHPRGFGVYSSAIDYFKIAFQREWSPPTLETAPVFFVILFGVWLTQILNWKQLRLFELIILTIFSYISIKSYSLIPLFLLTALPILAGNMADLFNRASVVSSDRSFFPKSGYMVSSLGLLLLLIPAYRMGFAFNTKVTPPGYPVYPEQGIAWILEHPVQGRLFTHDLWGGYTGWMSDNRIKVFLDGRTHAFQGTIRDDYRRIIDGDHQGCLQLLENYKIEGLFVSPTSNISFFEQLWRSENWSLIYWDDLCHLYLRHNSQNSDLIRRFKYQAVEPKRTPPIILTDQALALVEIHRASEIAPDSFLPYYYEGIFYLFSNAPDSAIVALELALSKSPKNSGTLDSLGLIAFQQKKYDTAGEYLRKSIRCSREGEEFEIQACYLLARTLKQDPSRWDEARYWASRALDSRPSWTEAQQLVNSLQSDMKDSK